MMARRSSLLLSLPAFASIAMCDNNGYIRRQGSVPENPNANESAQLDQASATSPKDRILLASVEGNGAINDFEREDFKEAQLPPNRDAAMAAAEKLFHKKIQQRRKRHVDKPSLEIEDFLKAQKKAQSEEMKWDRKQLENEKSVAHEKEKSVAHAHKTSHGPILDPRFTQKFNRASLAENPKFDKFVAEQEEATKEALKREQEWSSKEEAREAALAKEHRSTSSTARPQKQTKAQMFGSDHDKSEIAEVSEGVVSADPVMLLQVSSSSSASHEKAKHVSKDSFIQRIFHPAHFVR